MGPRDSEIFMKKGFMSPFYEIKPIKKEFKTKTSGYKRTNGKN